MKTIATLAALLLGSTVAFAGPFGLPDHQPNGYRDTGCDPAQQVQITNDAGDYLYSNNPSCPAGKGATDAPEVEEVVVTPPDDGEGEGEEPVDPKA